MKKLLALKRILTGLMIMTFLMGSVYLPEAHAGKLTRELKRGIKKAERYRGVMIGYLQGGIPGAVTAYTTKKATEAIMRHNSKKATGAVMACNSKKVTGAVIAHNNKNARMYKGSKIEHSRRHK
jgi:hypothetical protein